MAVHINRIEEGELTRENEEDDSSKQEVPSTPKAMKWGLLLLSSTFYFVGLVGGPLLLRLYFLHGGNRKWLSSWSQMAGFPGLLVPLTILYYRRDPSLPNSNFFASRKLLLCAALIGLAQGLQNFMYSYGLSFLPVSTASLLIATQLVSTCLFSFFWVKQKFTPFSINAVVLLIMGSILLGIRRAGDRPPGVSNSQYLLGFFMTIASAAIVGFILVSTQVAYAKANQSMTYPIVLQFQFCLSLFATVFSTFGGLINKDFSAMHEEATGYKLGAKAYYLVLVSNMVVWQIMFVGRVGIIVCTSSLFAGVMTSTFLPITQVAAVLTFHESFPAEKGMALALTLWGFVSYLFGSYKNTNKQTKKPAHESKETAIQSND
ncbi:hypothetical protein MKW94_000969 [Papaver nudicaule]|uniref:Probable purine permease n=1 Tax=Papaver nudicaule TaxID=74823 RepID=A0AA41VEU4_PAPNU|nr:hypothetical protein [Papaver nudicaule]